MRNWLAKFFHHQDYVASSAAAYCRGDYDSAQKIALRGLDSAPKNQVLLAVVGNVYYIAQNYAEASKYYQRILSENPHNQEAQINLGEALLRQQKYAEALTAAQQIQDPAAAMLLRAKVAFEQEDFAAAEAEFQRALARRPNDYWGWCLLAQAAQKSGHFAPALDAAFQAVEQSNGADSQHLNLAYSLYEIALEKGTDFVLPWLQKWHQKYGDNGIVKQSWNSFFPKADFARADAHYVQQVFDNFADSFEEILQGLNYVVPQKIAAEIAADSAVQKISQPRILDLGCGTGLCAARLDSLLPNSVFWGVDLSAQMLQKAAAKKLYQKLFCDDLNHFLQAAKQEFDIIIAADVFTYFGALENLLADCQSCLCKNGLIVFSATAATDPDSTWQQHLSGRFLHSQKYLKKVLLQSGFQSLKFAPCVLRQEAEKDVCGWIISAVKK